MKAEISDTGKLYIQRKDRMKVQHCPFAREPTFCGDFCPLFSEPTPDNRITLCNNQTIKFDTLTDYRR